MPIRIPDALPATSALERENIFVMTENRALHQDIRPLRLVLLNLMPTKIETETQILRKLSNTPLQIEVSLLQTASHKATNVSAQHLEAFYTTFDQIKDERFDGLIITGAPVEQLDFEEVDYWPELCSIMEWSRTNVHSTLHICWGAQAGIYFHYGVPKYPLPEKMFGIFQEYQSWVRIMGVPTVGDGNSKVLAGDGGGLIKLAEAFHERKFAWVADTIYDAHRSRGARMVLTSGPSSSGKTTSAKRLGIQLGVLGLNPVLISLDDYFVDREKTPRDADGNYDYEALEAIDLELFNDHLARLIRGESVDIPRYDFITGRRTWHNAPLTLDERSILIIEGIHGLNPRLTPSIPDAQKFRIYISCFTSVAMDNLSRIATTDNRLLRRLTRDYRQRGADALSTLSRWASVRRGEEKHIFPYQENADIMLNSSLFYEISVLRPFAEKILREVPDTVPEYDEARRMLKFLDNFIPIAPDEIPPTSILREFIGGSSFQY